VGLFDKGGTIDQVASVWTKVLDTVAPRPTPTPAVESENLFADNPVAGWANDALGPNSPYLKGIEAALFPKYDNYQPAELILQDRGGYQPYHNVFDMPVNPALMDKPYVSPWLKNVTPNAKVSGTAGLPGIKQVPLPGSVPVTMGTTGIEQAIDKYAAGDNRISLAMKLGVLMETGSFEGGGSAVGDNGQSFGWYQIHQPAHGRNITPQQSQDPDAATRYMLSSYKAGVDRVTRENASLWETDPYQAARLAAFYAERPAEMYPDDRYARARATLQQRQAAPRSTGGTWDHVVPGGQGRVESGGTHGGSPAVDIFAPAGTPIYAPVDGVSSPGTYSLGGNATTIRGADGRYYYFAHAQSPMAGGQVRKGQIIGYVGNTGNARNTPAHLHYAVASNANVFGQRNGSGDLDPSYAY
jgi:hypothetical protein